MHNSTHKSNNDIVIAVMGATSTGKSTFIHLLTGDNNIVIGHKQQSETTEIQEAKYVDQATGRSVTLIDTPGFDDSRDGITDTDILERIVNHLEPGGGEPRHKLNGIIYMHRISDARVGGVSRKNIRMFRSLCGQDQLGNVRIITTNWSRLQNEQEGRDREADLKSNAFEALLKCGAKMRRHANSVESARKIISELIALRPVTTQVQIELHQGKKLSETAAGVTLAAEMREMQNKHEHELAKLKQEMASAAKANDRALRAELERERKAMEGRMARMEADRQRLNTTLREQQHAQQSRANEERANSMRLLESLQKEHSKVIRQMARADKLEAQLGKMKQCNLEEKMDKAKKRIKVLEQCLARRH